MGIHIVLIINAADKISTVKEKIQGKIAIKPEFQRLAGNGLDLNDERTLLDYNVCPGQTLWPSPTGLGVSGYMDTMGGGFDQLLVEEIAISLHHFQTKNFQQLLYYKIKLKIYVKKQNGK